MHRTMKSRPVQSNLRCLVLAAGVLATSFAGAQTCCSGAQPWGIGPFVRPTEGPVIEPNKFYYFLDPLSHERTYWEALHTFNPAATIAPNGDVAVVFRAEDASGTDEIGGHTSRLGLATSKDGLQFTTEGAPVLYAANDYQKIHEFPGGVEDPRIVVAPDGTYVMTYTQWARDAKQYTIGIATSKDLEEWTKFGPAFGDAEQGRYAKMLYKSGGILTELHNGRITAVKLHGKYWMYWGEIQVRLATSDDLIHWTPVIDPQTHLPKVIMTARPGHFDSAFPEVGAPPLLTKKGIVLLYNGKNAGSPPAKVVAAGASTTPTAPVTDASPVEPEMQGDPKIGPGAYSVGEALFSSSDPAKLLARTDKPVLTPVWPYERNGQYTAGTTFAEGLVAFQGQWLLYYGAADSVVGVARAAMPR